jgi:DNA-binding transcriptional MocR family regulator
MTIWVPDLSRHSGPRYQAIADAIAGAVAAGELAPGSRLPPQRDLAWKLGVTVGTVSRGYMLAEQRGLLSGEVGRGTFVREAASAGAELLPETDSGLIDLTRNAAGSTEHADAVRAAMQTLAGRRGLQRLLHYMPSAGHPAHRATGARWIGRTGLGVTPEQVVMTGGAQQAIAIALGTLAAPGETVLCDSLTYCGLMEAARLFRLRLEGVEMDDGGLSPEALDRLAREKGARLVFAVPTIQNPTVITMDAARRRDIAAVARARDLTIIEDDVYGFLPSDRPPPLATLAPERTVYIASVSKCVAPGLRIGWLAGPPALTERFSDALHGLSLALPPLPAEILRLWVEDGTAARLTERLRADIAARQRLATEILAGLTLRGDPASFHVLLHLPEPWRREEYVSAARAQGVAVVPASTFAVGRVSAPHAVRISLAAAPDLATLRRALEILRDIALADPKARRAVI